MNQTMILSRNHPPAMFLREEDAVVVTTPLDAIVRLERGRRISKVVLAGSYASDAALVSFLGAFYPTVEIQRAF
jgi:hypothetical protein